jgi:uncharacterized protein (TIGR02246 family)
MGKGIPASADTRAQLIATLQRFCSAFADRDADAVMSLTTDPDLVLVTSEKPLLRGQEELRLFLDSYIKGATTYSWQWDRYDIASAGPVAWLLAEGTETATTDSRPERHHYRMTMVFEHIEGQWLLRQVHGSSPQ